MRLTFSKLDTYSKCPLRFRLRYQDKLPEAPRRGRNLSLILHQTLEAFLLQARRDSSLERLLRCYEIRCAPHRLQNKSVATRRDNGPWKPSTGEKGTG